MIIGLDVKGLALFDERTVGALKTQIIILD
jgi:hypothetical protein